MKEFFRSLWFKIMLLVIAVFLGFLLYEASTGNLSFPSQLLGAIAQPFETATSWVSKTLSDFFEPVIHAGDYKKENIDLKNEISDLKNQMTDYNSLKNQIEQLQDIAGIKQENPSFEMEPATVIAKDSNDANLGFTINAGSLKGIKKNDPVITRQGLVGIVTDVSLTYAQVTTILSPNLSISARDSNTQTAGVLTGDLALMKDHKCKLQYLDRENQLQTGDAIVTSGAGGLYPANLMIGSVQEMKIENHGISAYAEIKTAVDIENIKDITVIKSFEGQQTE